jgi:hypothetical protein
MNKIVLLTIAALLILIGLVQPDFSSLFPQKSNNVVVSLESPDDEDILKECKDVAKILSSGDKKDAARLRDLYIDISDLIALDGDQTVIKSTEDIRQANSLAGVMLKLDIKDKYADLGKETQQVIVSVIGDDSVLLSPELRTQASQSFKYLAWACNEGVK